MGKLRLQPPSMKRLEPEIAGDETPRARFNFPATPGLLNVNLEVSSEYCPSTLRRTAVGRIKASRPASPPHSDTIFIDLI